MKIESARSGVFYAFPFQKQSLFIAFQAVSTLTDTTLTVYYSVPWDPAFMRDSGKSIPGLTWCNTPIDCRNLTIG